MDDYITRVEHEEFRKRLEDENNRQNHRIGELEKTAGELHTIAMAVERLATNMESMAKEQEKQGLRLESLESRDGEKWRKVVGYVVTAVVGGAITYILTNLGL